MHNASTKQRLSALRRKLGIFTGWQPPRWVRERRKRIAPSGAVAGVSLGIPAASPDVPTEVVVAPAADPHPAAAMVDAVGVETAPVGPRYVNAPAAVRGPRSSGDRRWLAAALALAAIAIAGGAFVLGQRPTAPDVPVVRAPPALDRGAAPVERAAASAVRVERASVGAQAASTVEVRKGDTLWHLAAIHLGDPLRWPELHHANARQVRDPDLIFPGQQLLLPRGASL